MEEPPKPIAAKMSYPLSRSKMSIKIQYPKATPKSPRPATENPITAPPLNATGRAFNVPPSLAASVVLPFAAVAILIPINPAKEENNAPPTNAIEPQG